MYGTVRVNCMTLVGGAGDSLHDRRSLCTILGGRGDRIWQRDGGEFVKGIRWKEGVFL